MIITDEILTHAIDLLRLDAATGRQVMTLLNQLQQELGARLRQDDLTKFTKDRLQTLLRQTTATIERYYGTAHGLVTETLQGVAGAQASHAGRLLNAVVAGFDAVLPTEAVLARLVSNVLIQGAPSSRWWARQSADVAFRFEQSLRAGIAQGQTNEQIVRTIVGTKTTPGILGVPRSNARALVHTSIQTVANAARVDTFQRNKDVIECLVWLATLDGHTCLMCAARDLHWYTLDDARAPLAEDPNGPGPEWGAGPGALHFGDRCIATIRVKRLDGLPEPPVGGRAAQGGPVKGNTRFEEFLKRKGMDWAEQTLGPGRAQLWRDKKLTLEQLLDMRGNPLSLKELRARYG